MRWGSEHSGSPWDGRAGLCLGIKNNPVHIHKTCPIQQGFPRIKSGLDWERICIKNSNGFWGTQTYREDLDKNLKLILGPPGLFPPPVLIHVMLPFPNLTEWILILPARLQSCSWAGGWCLTSKKESAQGSGLLIPAHDLEASF